MKNIELMLNNYSSSNLYNIPDIPKQTFKKIPENLFPVSYREKYKYPSLVHFFIDDEKFECSWNNPQKTMNSLKNENVWAVCGPDYSMYSDMPEAVQIYQVYRNRVISAYWSKNGIRVIPTIMFSNKKSLEYSFVGIEKNQIVAMPVMLRGTDEEHDNFINGYLKMIKEIRPRIIICFGEEIDLFRRDDIEKIYFPKGHFKQKEYRYEQEGC